MFNHDQIIIFNMQDFTKQKRVIKNEDFPHLWNCQSIEVKGSVYLSGGSIANTKTYLTKSWVLDEKTWCFNQLAEMRFARDAHGVIAWKDSFIIVVGSWHVE